MSKGPSISRHLITFAVALQAVAMLASLKSKIAERSEARVEQANLTHKTITEPIPIGTGRGVQIGTVTTMWLISTRVG
jgi:hypothetical protein